MPTVPNVIYQFEKDYAFLHNFYPCEVIFDGLTYPSAEHAYQAAKSQDPNVREIVRNLLDGQTAKSYGHRKVRQSPEFMRIRNEVMRTILQAKFFNNIQLAKMLVETGESQLVFGQPPGQHDPHWGMSRSGSGENMLGILLMETRKLISDAIARDKSARMRKVKFSAPKPQTPIEDLTARLSQLEHSTANNPDRDPSFKIIKAKIRSVELSDSHDTVGLQLSNVEGEIKPGDIIVDGPGRHIPDVGGFPLP